MKNYRWPLGLLYCFWCFSVGAIESASIPVFSQISRFTLPADIASVQSPPHFVRQPQSELSDAFWIIQRPKSESQAVLPAWLVPQSAQGSIYKLDNEVIDELNESNPQIEIRKTSHLSNWLISPMIAGDLSGLNPYLFKFTLLSHDFYTTINALSAAFGILFLVIGLRSKSQIYLYGGMTTLTWGLLLTAAWRAEMPTSNNFYWQIAIYATTGLLAYFISMFTLTAFGYVAPKIVQFTGLAYLNIGWLLYATVGTSAEKLIDFAWAGLAGTIYLLITAVVVYKALRKHQFTRALPIIIYLTVILFLAFQDYLVRSGNLSLSPSETPQSMWAALMLRPIYLTHAGLPVFIAITMWLLIQDHKNKTYSELRHVSLMNEQRERIVNDIHDGVGSRINLLLWSLRTASPDKSQIESDLQRCLEELRFAINPKETGYETLHKALSDLCQRIKITAHQQGIEFDFIHIDNSISVTSAVGLNLYKATQECLSNALRHSQATHIHVMLKQSANGVCIEIQDNGIGIPDWDETSQKQKNQKSTSMGLISLFQRIKSKGGTIHISSNNEGTNIYLFG